MIKHLLLLLVLCAPVTAARLPQGWADTLARASAARAFLDRTNVWTSDELPWQPLDPFSRRKLVYTERACMALLEVQRSGKPHDLTHWHPHDQITLILSGTGELAIGREIKIVTAGTIFRADANVPHSMRILSEKLTLVDVFAPPREDFRGGSKAASAGVAPPPAPAENEVKALVYQWFALFDSNAPVEAFLPCLVPGGLKMVFPEVTLSSREDFARWYGGVLAAVASASHTLHRVEVEPAGDGARVKLYVTWRAVTRTGAKKVFRVAQEWRVVRDAATGQLQIAQYHVRVL